MRLLRRRAFTLIELLVVVTIILILVGILLPALGYVRTTAKKTRARDSVGQLVVCWRSYLNDYRTFPNLQLTEMGYEAVEILTASSNAVALNRDRITYMEFTTNQVANGYVDPWGNVFQIALDAGLPPRDSSSAHDGIITPFPGIDVSRSVAVWSKGVNGKDGTTEERLDDLRSWGMGD